VCQGDSHKGPYLHDENKKCAWLLYFFRDVLSVLCARYTILQLKGESLILIQMYSLLLRFQRHLFHFAS